MITVKNFVGDELEITIDFDGDICIEDICGNSASYTRWEALQMAAILNHYALTGELKLP